MRARRCAAVALLLAALAALLCAPLLTRGVTVGDGPEALGRALGVLSLLPPVLAVALAFLLRDVMVSLLAGFVCGAGLLVSLSGGGVGAVFTRSCTTLLETVSDQSNCTVIVLCLVIGGMVEVIRSSGGFEALARTLTRRIDTPRKANLVGELLGVIVFFDDYANSLIVGPVMKPVTDKLLVSREKLAYLVDSTAAPVTGIAVVSSWVAVEVSVINEGFAAAGIPLGGYSTFLESIPYCFYCIFCLLFILESSLMGREYGPMLTAEIRARRGEPLRPGSAAAVGAESAAPTDKQRLRIVTALLPIVLLCVVAFISFYTNGRAAAEAAGDVAPGAPFSLETVALSFGSADTIFLVTEASVLGSLVAIALGCVFRLFPLRDAVHYWLKGAAGLLPTAVILALAWSLSATVAELGTVYYVVDFISANVAWQLVPALIFLVCCVISFAAGSFGCLFIVMPMAIPIAAAVLTRAAVPHEHAFLLCCVASVLSGSIFGDHCSPITDCTILSSMGSGCDNLDHVRTQMPYALTVAAVSVLCGSLPVALGLSVWLALPLGCAALAVVLLLAGRNPDRLARAAAPESAASGLTRPKEETT